MEKTINGELVTFVNNDSDKTLKIEGVELSKLLTKASLGGDGGKSPYREGTLVKFTGEFTFRKTTSGGSNGRPARTNYHLCFLVTVNGVEALWWASTFIKSVIVYDKVDDGFEPRTYEYVEGTLNKKACESGIGALENKDIIAWVLENTKDKTFVVKRPILYTTDANGNFRASTPVVTLVEKA